MDCLPFPWSHGMEKARLGQALLRAGHCPWAPCAQRHLLALFTATMAASHITVGNRGDIGGLSSHSESQPRKLDIMWGTTETAHANQWKNGIISQGKTYAWHLYFLISHRLRHNFSLHFWYSSRFWEQIASCHQFEFTIFIAHWSNYWYTWFHTFHSTT